MIADNVDAQGSALTPDVVRGITFPGTRGRGLGLDEERVRAFQERVADAMEGLSATLEARDREIAELRKRIMSSDNEEQVHQAVAILQKAQETADTVIAEANAYSGQVTAEANATYEDARQRAAHIVAEAERTAVLAAQVASSDRDDAQRDAVYWHTYRESLINQLQMFLNSISEHLDKVKEHAEAPAPPSVHARQPQGAGGAASARGSAPAVRSGPSQPSQRPFA